MASAKDSISAGVRSPAGGYLSIPFGEDAEVSMRTA